MRLNHLVDKFHERYCNVFESSSHFYYSSAAFLTMKALDVASTYLNVSKYGIQEGEGNELTKWAMETFGVTPGLAIKNIPLIVAALGIGYLVNKNLKDEMPNIGSILLYAVALKGYLISAQNFFYYFHKSTL